MLSSSPTNLLLGRRVVPGHEDRVLAGTIPGSIMTGAPIVFSAFTTRASGAGAAARGRE
jgi:hypothetical protein